MAIYNLYNPQKDKFVATAKKIDIARKKAMDILKKDWSVGYIAINDGTPIGFVARNVKDYYTPEKILRFDWIVEDHKQNRMVYDLNQNGSLGKRRF